MNIIGLAGWSGAGKTTLLARVLPLLTARGLSVSTVKHAHHAFEIDHEGKDSFVHRQAGATEVLVASSGRYALIHELRGAPEPGLGELLGKLAPVDLVVVEGFKAHVHPKVEIHRAANGKPFLFDAVPNVRALVSDAAATGWTGARAHLDDLPAVADLLLGAAEPLDAVLAKLASAGSPARLPQPPRA
jgi:molybdopterin-guanine dinucleotide biosynthesis adapter protein